MEFEPEDFLETVADKLHIVENQAAHDLENFKRFIESEGYETGAWRGSISQGAPVRTPGVEDAASSFGDAGIDTDQDDIRRDDPLRSQRLSRRRTLSGLSAEETRSS